MTKDLKDLYDAAESSSIQSSKIYWWRDGKAAKKRDAGTNLVGKPSIE